MDGHGLPLLLGGGQGGQHGPVGDVHDGVGHAPEDIDDREVGVLGKAFQTGVTEHEDHDGRVEQGADENPGAELTPAGAGVVHHKAHHGVVDGVPHPGHQEQVAHKEGVESHGVGEVDHQECGDHGVAQVLAQGAYAKTQFSSGGQFHSFLPSVTYIVRFPLVTAVFQTGPRRWRSRR